MSLSTTPVFNVVVLGDSGVGKTQFVSTFSARDHLLPSIDAVELDVGVEGETLRIRLWDAPASHIQIEHFIFADACILIYDLSDIATFQNLRFWKSLFETEVGLDDSSSFPFCVVGNKCDLSNVNVSDEDSSQWCIAEGISCKSVCSSATKEGVMDCVCSLSQRLLWKNPKELSTSRVSDEVTPEKCRIHSSSAITLETSCLFKGLRNGNNRHRRWCVLKGWYLYIFAHEKEYGVAEEVINLLKTPKIDVLNDSDVLGFRLSSSTASMEIILDSQRIRDKMIEGVRRAIQEGNAYQKMQNRRYCK